MTFIFYAVIVISLAGCMIRNAEQMVWNEDGQKTSQVRTGEFAFGYWFGMKHFSIKKDPNNFEVWVDTSYARPDPNSIEAVGKGMGQVIGISINKIGGL